MYTTVVLWVLGLWCVFSVEAQPSTQPSSHPSLQLSTLPSVASTGGSPSPTSFFRCGCADCTEDIWTNSLADEFPCGTRISFAMRVNDLTEFDACIKVSNEFPDECGAFCNPNQCASTRCGCQECDEEALDRVLFSTMCRTRIDGFKNPQGAGLTELEACLEASQYCGFQCDSCPQECNPLLCDGKASPICSCTECELDTVVDPNDIGLPTCQDKLLALWYEQLRDDPLADREVACQMVAEQYPLHCGKCNPTTCEQPRIYCGCLNCTEEVWQSEAGAFSCGSRIRYVAFESPDGDNKPLLDACRQIASEFPETCGPECNPDLCDRAPSTPSPTALPTIPRPTASPSSQPQFLPPASTPSTDEPTAQPEQRVIPNDANRPVLPTVPPSASSEYRSLSFLRWLFLFLLLQVSIFVATMDV